MPPTKRILENDEDCFRVDKRYEKMRLRNGQGVNDTRLKKGHPLTNRGPKLEMPYFDPKIGAMQTITGPALWECAQAEPRVHTDPDVANIKANDARVQKIREQRLKHEAAEKAKNHAKMEELRNRSLKHHEKKMESLRNLKVKREPSQYATMQGYHKAVYKCEEDGEGCIVPDDDEEALKRHYVDGDPLDEIDGNNSEDPMSDVSDDSCDDDEYELPYQKDTFARAAATRRSVRPVLNEDPPEFVGDYGNVADSSDEE